MTEKFSLHLSKGRCRKEVLSIGLFSVAGFRVEARKAQKAK